MTLDELFVAGWNPGYGYCGPKKMTDALYTAGRNFLHDLGLRVEPVRPPDDCFLVNADDGHSDGNDCLCLEWHLQNGEGDDEQDRLIVSIVEYGNGVTVRVEMACIAVVEPKDYARKIGGLIEWLS